MIENHKQVSECAEIEHIIVAISRGDELVDNHFMIVASWPLSSQIFKVCLHFRRLIEWHSTKVANYFLNMVYFLQKRDSQFLHTNFSSPTNSILDRQIYRHDEGSILCSKIVGELGKLTEPCHS